ncbi:unnamed protein product [Somion occarium]|uniref:Uncharacterized protein n=1 Tax=Somion occarium TaxID=3059160 RepID=A0ABP1E3N7_9APHY
MSYPLKDPSSLEAQPETMNKFQSTAFSDSGKKLNVPPVPLSECSNIAKTPNAACRKCVKPLLVPLKTAWKAYAKPVIANTKTFGAWPVIRGYNSRHGRVPTTPFRVFKLFILR